MRADVIYASLATLATAAANISPAGPVIWNMGDYPPIPIVPALIGMLSALLVRIIVVTTPNSKKRFFDAYNISITLLAMIAAGIWIWDRQLGPGQSFWTGVGCGALGVSIVELARSQFFGALKSAIIDSLGKPKSPRE